MSTLSELDVKLNVQGDKIVIKALQDVDDKIIKVIKSFRGTDHDSFKFIRPSIFNIADRDSQDRPRRSPIDFEGKYSKQPSYPSISYENKLEETPVGQLRSGMEKFYKATNIGGPQDAYMRTQERALSSSGDPTVKISNDNLRQNEIANKWLEKIYQQQLDNGATVS